MDRGPQARPLEMMRSRFIVNHRIQLALATASALVAVSGMVYSFAIGGFQYYDPRLMKIMGVGGLLSLVSLILGLSGLCRANPLRWHAPVLAISTFAFWIAAGAGE